MTKNKANPLKRHCSATLGSTFHEGVEKEVYISISETHTFVIVAYASWQVGLLVDQGKGVQVGGGLHNHCCYCFLNTFWGKQGQIVQGWGHLTPRPHHTH